MPAHLRPCPQQAGLQLEQQDFQHKASHTSARASNFLLQYASRYSWPFLYCWLIIASERFSDASVLRGNGILISFGSSKLALLGLCSQSSLVESLQQHLSCTRCLSFLLTLAICEFVSTAMMSGHVCSISGSSVISVPRRTPTGSVSNTSAVSYMYVVLSTTCKDAIGYNTMSLWTQRFTIASHSSVVHLGTSSRCTSILEGALPWTGHFSMVIMHSAIFNGIFSLQNKPSLGQCEAWIMTLVVTVKTLNGPDVILGFLAASHYSPHSNIDWYYLQFVPSNQAYST